MDKIGAYLISVTAASIICSVIMGILGSKGTNAAIIRMLCGLFLAITMLAPIVQLETGDISSWFAHLQTDAGAAAQWGKLAAMDAAAEIIIRDTEAYILDKASSMGLSLEAEVTLSEGEIQKPVAVRLSGSASPYARRQLKIWIRDNLGIPEENQIWI